MIVADPSALLSLGTIDLLDIFLEGYDVHTTLTVVQELDETREYDDNPAEAAETVYEHLDRINVDELRNGEFTSSRVDPGEGSCALLTKELDTEFLIIDDLQALPELQTVADAQVAISPIVLKALFQRNLLTRKDALEKLDQMAEARNWLDAPIYRRAKQLFTSSE